MSSLWEQEQAFETFECLKENINTDILIIGGGMAGLLCAYMLHMAGADYVLVEAERICGGITKNTTAKITSQHGLIYDKLMGRFGQELAGQYYRANQEALDMYRRICANLDCDFEQKDAYVYSLKNRSKIQKELRALEKLAQTRNSAPESLFLLKLREPLNFPLRRSFIH